MTDPGFRVEGIHQAAPFRERAAFSGYLPFGDESRMVLVEPETGRRLRAAAACALPKETGGLLSGRTLRDGDGQYVLISGFVQAGPTAGRSFAFSVSPQATARLREESARAHPTADVVGWWHSHSAPSDYSQVDRNTQTIFKQPDSVGLLVFARGEPWAKAYMGPEARELALMARVRARQEENGHAVDDDRHGQRQQVLNIPNPPQDDSRANSRSRGLVRLTLIMGSVLLLTLILVVIALFALQNLSSRVDSVRQLAKQLASGQQQLSQQFTHGITAPSATPSVSVSCAAVITSKGHYTGNFACTATPTAHGKIEWKVDGDVIKSGPTATIPVRLHHSDQVQALLTTSAGTYPSTPQTLTA